MATSLNGLGQQDIFSLSENDDELYGREPSETNDQIQASAPMSNDARSDIINRMSEIFDKTNNDMAPGKGEGSFYYIPYNPELLSRGKKVTVEQIIKESFKQREDSGKQRRKIVEECRDQDLAKTGTCKEKLHNYW